MDSRDKEAMYGDRLQDRFDRENMTLTYELMNDDGDEFEAVFPAKFEVCGLCNGKGTHVNPSIDAHGISAEEFYDDPDFAEGYMNGRYDVTCYRCKGANVEPVIDEDNLSAEDKEDFKLLEKYWRDEADYRRECEAERRYGC